MGYIGSTFTWWNGRADEAIIFKRLDRVLCNQKMMDKYPQMTVTHLIKKGSDHAPLELKVSTIMASLEEVIVAHKAQFEADHSTQNRAMLHKVQAELNRYLHLEEEYWKQKAGLKWFEEGERSTKFFHSYVNGRRKKLRLTSIQNENCDWLTSKQDIVDEAVRFYSRQFSADKIPEDFDPLMHIPNIITSEHNQKLMELRSEEKIKATIFGLNGDSANGPDGFTALYFQNYWDIVKDDTINMKQIISRLLHDILVQVLPLLISKNQAGFVKGSIVKNVLLTQEIVRDIARRTKLANMVVKLEMMKAYDRVSWLFLTKERRSFGFSEIIIDMVFRLVSNNWYSVLLNGKSHGFFKSSRVVKQRDPLSPTLFSPSNFTKLCEEEVNKVDDEDCQGIYEDCSSPFVNLNKSAFYVHHKVSSQMIRSILDTTNIRKGTFTFTYLGCPIYYERNKIAYYDGILKKIWNRIQSWQGKLLSYGQRAVLISNVLQSMPMHLLSSMSPPIGVIRLIHRMLARFFLSYNTETRSSLYFVVPDISTEDEIEVKQFSKRGEWDVQALKDLFPEDTIHVTPPMPMTRKASASQRGKAIADEGTTRVPPVDVGQRESQSEAPSQTAPALEELRRAVATAPPVPPPDTLGQEMRDVIRLLTRLAAAQAQRQGMSVGYANRVVSAMVRYFINLDPPVFSGSDPVEDP
ncbi:uncharacterized protein LOC132607892 [Lycium barbarum]|uniref:uncharacterized protein LOC132607892 n=1 Tax=Lycium barbarum TaxID=112863 RepID=UPI00293F4C49|nr:uncharacterized protein LOC132607892 [Lycium barbarum]